MHVLFLKHVTLASGIYLALSGIAHAEDAEAKRRKAEYVEAVVRGAGFVEWQARGVSAAEKGFRETMEARKTEMLAERVPVEHPVMMSREDIAQLRRKVEEVAWARKWFERQLSAADYVAKQPSGYVERMIPALTPTRAYGLTCPNCVGTKSQEGAGYGGFSWDYRKPEVIRCRKCGHVYPSEQYPETAKLVCPRSGQGFTYYLNEEERRHPEDRSGKYAYHWVGRPVHMSFTGIIRERKVGFMIGAVRSLALAYAITGEPSYAERAADILVRLADCYRRWLYHDYWDTIADCDPLYAAWHWSKYPLEWKRHLCADAYKKDTLSGARMLQSYWGAGRVSSSTDSVSGLKGLALAYDLVHDARGGDGRELWTPQRRAKVERDLLMEYLMGAEPFVGGRGKAECVNNKAPRIYCAMAAVAKCLGITEWADTALRGYEAIRDRSFNYDGFSHETPSYNNMYLGPLVWIPEMLHGFRWPEGFAKRTGVVDLYETDARLGLMYRALIDQTRTDGGYLPLGDSNVGAKPTPLFYEIGVKRYPGVFSGTLPWVHRGGRPSEYAVLNLTVADVERDTELKLREIFFPRWMVGILRHGKGRAATTLALSFSPAGGHRHRDNLSLFYVDRGRRILGDHGYVGDMPVNAWIKDTRSHNLVVVDDAEQRFSGRRPRLHMMVTSPMVSAVEASSAVYKQCGEYRRLVALIKGAGAETFAVDIFRVKGGKKHAYRLFSELASSDAADGTLVFEGLTMPAEKPLPKVGNSLKRADIFGLRDVRRVGDPPSQFQTIWKEKSDSYRAWILTQGQSAEASNGPGQQKRGGQAGRRVRYLDVVRMGTDLASTFVAVHEPSGPNGAMPVKSAERLAVPASAGPDAVAVRVESAWGTYLLLSKFAAEAEVDGVRFEGSFGVVCKGADGKQWLLASGARTLRQGEFGFADSPARWSGEVKAFTKTTLRPATPRPAGWPALPENCRNYVLINDGEYETGFPVEKADAETITVRRFPVPAVKGFDLPALRTMRR